VGIRDTHEEEDLEEEVDHTEDGCTRTRTRREVEAEGLLRAIPSAKHQKSSLLDLLRLKSSQNLYR
jgi:hypothetical protein